jgi:2-polyprenyl-3-methyl-5-hydroxy-6-metoxy-1,4-benzoquinol methylase
MFRVNTIKCPYCGSTGNYVGRKKLLLSLYECPTSGLRYRVPKGYLEERNTFYEREYDEPTVTNLPTSEQVRERDFEEYLKDRTPYLSAVLEEIAPSSVLDYGCSWGYAVDWMRRRGVEKTVGYEISKPAADFGRSKLGIEIFSNLDALKDEYEGAFDLIYTAHVMEHLEGYNEIFDAFRRLLSSEGKIAIVVPNASDEALRSDESEGWGHLVGEVHTTALTYSYYEYALPREGFVIEQTGPRNHPEIRLIARRDS